MSVQIPVYVVVFEHRHGIDTAVFGSQAEAHAYDAAWCREWWAEIGQPETDPFAISDDEVRDLYWAYQMEMGDESCSITQCSLALPVPPVDADNLSPDHPTKDSAA